MPTLLKDPQGNPVWVADDRAASAIDQGYTAERTDANDLTKEDRGQGGVGGGVIAGATSALSGATLGLSDVALRGLLSKGRLEDVAAARNEHPIISTGANILGAVAPALLTGGGTAGESGLSDIASLANATPAGQIARVGARIAGLGDEAGALGKAAYTAGAGALEGAAQNAGSYVSDVALGDRDLSADGFLGAMGKGALYGGVAGGALSVANNGLIAARRLFPAAEVTPQAVARAEFWAKKSLRESLDDSVPLEQTARQELAKAEAVQASSKKLQAEVAAADAHAAEAASNAAPDDLMARLVATKKKLDAGQALGEAAMSGEVGGEAALASWLAKHPGGMVELDAMTPAVRRATIKNWAEKFEPVTGADETVKQYTLNPKAEATNLRLGGGEGPIGRVSGVPDEINAAAKAEAARAARAGFGESLAENINISKSGPELMARSTYGAKRAAAKAADDVYTSFRASVDELAAARSDLMRSLAGDAETAAPATLAEKVLSGPAPGPDEMIAKALGKSKDVNADIAEIAPKITRYEAARAQVADALGPKAPTEAIDHAAAMRAAQQRAETSTARQAAQAADNVDKMALGAPATSLPAGSPLAGIAGKAANAGAAYELLRSLGVPLPDIKHVPVIGPLLSMFLKAKLVAKVAGKFGGSFAATAEGTIAAKATQTIDRVHAAIGTMLEGSTKAAATIGGPAAALGHKLFDEDIARKPYKSDPELDDLGNMYQSRMQELIAAQRPGAIDQAVRARIATGDPTIVDAIVAAETRKAQYLLSVAPKSDDPAPGQPRRLPSKTEITNWGIVVAAAHDPAAIFERVAAGGVARPEEVDCVQNCYPALYAAGQRHLLQRLAEMKTAIPYARRIAASVAWGIPMDVSLMPGRLPSPQLATAQPAMPHPSISGSITLGQRTATRLDRE